MFVLAAFAAPVVQEEVTTVTIHADDTLNEVLADLVEVNEVSISYDQEVAEVLVQMRTGLLADVQVSADQFQPLVEGLLASHGVGLSAITVPGIRVLVAHLVSENPFESSEGEIVSEEELALHSALRVRYRASFPALNYRQLPAALRAITRPTGALLLEPEKESLLLEGTGTRIGDVVSILGAISSPEGNEMFSAKPDSFFTPTSAPLELESAKSLLDLVRAYNKVTDLNVVVTKEARKELRLRRLGSHEDSVPADKVHAFVSNSLYHAGFATTIPGATEPSLLLVDLESNGMNIRNLPVSFSSLEEFERLPSLRVMIPMILKHADARKMPLMVRVLPGLAGGVFSIGFGGTQRQMIIGGRAGDLVEPWSAIIAADKQ